jgi:uncharacterized protein
MNILIDLSHPAHVHFFKHAARIWQERGHRIQFAARNKDVTFQLLDAYGYPYQGLSAIRKGISGLGFELLEHEWRLARLAVKFKADVMLNIGGTFIVHAGKLLGIPAVVFTDTEHAKLSNAITFPFADWICTPSCYTSNLGKKQVRYNGSHELAYLHPNYFTPDSRILNEIGIEREEKFFLVRFVTWGASHDIGQGGFSDEDKRELIFKLSRLGKVFITSEGQIPDEFESHKLPINPVKIHDLLSYCNLYIGEGATMAAEAAILGTPSIYVNTLTAGTIEELVNKYRLLHRFTEGSAAIEKAVEMANGDYHKSVHCERKRVYLNEKIDVTAWVVEFIEKIP